MPFDNNTTGANENQMGLTGDRNSLLQQGKQQESAIEQEAYTSSLPEQEKLQQNSVKALPQTPEELERLLQQTADKRVNQAVEKVRNKLEQEWLARLEVEKREAVELARMSESERFLAIQRKKETELARREEELIRRERRSTAVEQLVARGLPPELAGALDYSSEEKCRASLSEVETVFRQAVQSGINSRLAQVSGIPKGTQVTDGTDPFVRGFGR